MPLDNPTNPADYEPVRVDGVAKRYTAPKFVVGVAPDGSEHKVAADNVRDWANRGAGWSIRGPWASDEPKAVSTDAVQEAEITISEERKPAAEVLEPLELLRREAAALGIEVDQRWGKRRLTQEIESAKAGQE